MYRRGSGRNGEPGMYQGNCGQYGAGITKFSGFAPYVEPEYVVDTKPYTCHKELQRLEGKATGHELRPSTSPINQPWQQETRFEWLTLLKFIQITAYEYSRFVCL